MKMTYSTYLKNARDAARLNRTQLATKVKTNHTRYNRYETGEVVPSLEMWERLMEVCKIAKSKWQADCVGFPEIQGQLDDRDRRIEIGKALGHKRTVAQIAASRGENYQRVYRTVRKVRDGQGA